MGKNLVIVLAIAIVVALPFLLRQEPEVLDWHQGDPILVVVSPHNEAIRYEFTRAFSDWHQKKYGRPVKVDFRSIGGTTEIIRYLTAEYASNAKAWWTRARGRPWPDGGSDAVVSNKRPATAPAALGELYDAFRATDDGGEVTCGIDVFFGGGEFDHSDAYRRGLTVAPWPDGQAPPYLFRTPDGADLIPQRISGETWRTLTVFGNVVSTFGICYNVDRLRDLKVTRTPAVWEDLADYTFFRQVGVADPDKSGSVAKAFEMIIHQKCHQAVAAAGYDAKTVDAFETRIAAYEKQLGSKYRLGMLPPDVPAAYQAAIERGWIDGVRLVQRIGANARYFTDSASKVPIDVSMGDAAIGMAIDFYGRYQAQLSRSPRGDDRMLYVTPVGGSSVSCDPISLLRGAPHRDVAARFIEFVLSEDGQRLWTYKPGTPGGPHKYALRRLPIRRDFYPSTNPTIQATHLRHLANAADDLADPRVDPYKLAEQFTYYTRWTNAHFSIQRKLIRAMCLDSLDELQAAWRAIHTHGGPAQCPEAMAAMQDLPTVRLTNARTGAADEVPLTWRAAPDIAKSYSDLEYMRKWNAAFRANYVRAARLAAEGK